MDTFGGLEPYRGYFCDSGAYRGKVGVRTGAYYYGYAEQKSFYFYSYRSYLPLVVRRYLLTSYNFISNATINNDNDDQRDNKCQQSQVQYSPIFCCLETLKHRVRISSASEDYCCVVFEYKIMFVVALRSCTTMVIVALWLSGASLLEAKDEDFCCG